MAARHERCQKVCASSSIRLRRGRSCDSRPELFDFQPDVVIHTLAMGEADGTAFARAFSLRTARLVISSSGDVYRDLEPDIDSKLDFSQDIAYDTTRIRAELGYREEIVEESDARLLTPQSRMT